MGRHASSVVVSFHAVLHDAGATGFWRLTQGGWVVLVHADGSSAIEQRSGRLMPVQLRSVVQAMREFCARDVAEFGGENARKNIQDGMQAAFA